MALIPYIVEALTADGGTNGLVQVADSSAFVVGAKVLLGSDTVDAVELIIDVIPDSTHLALRLATRWSRFDSSDYTTGDNAIVTQNEQDNNAPSYESSDAVLEASAAAAAASAAASQASATGVTTVTIISASTYTVLSTDNKKHLLFTASGGCTVTVPVTLLKGFQCSWEQQGAAQVVFSGTAVAAATLHNRSSQTKSAGLYAVGGLSVSSGTGANAVVTLFGDTGA